MDEYITRNNAISAVCLGCNQQFSDEPCEPSDCTIRRSIMALPAADVAPRAEVDLYKKLNEELEDELASTYDKLENSRVEVAREIFEEIEKILNDSTIVSSSDGGRPYFNITNFRYGIFRLKTKYKEEQK